MPSELSFLLDLLLNHKHSKPIRDIISSRIKEVEVSMKMHQHHPLPPPTSATQRPLEMIKHQVRDINAQSPSTLAILAKNPDLIPEGEVISATPAQPPPPLVPVEQIAQTPAATQALLHRQQSIQQARSGQPAPGEKSPRKF